MVEAVVIAAVVASGKEYDDGVVVTVMDEFEVLGTTKVVVAAVLWLLDHNDKLDMDMVDNVVALPFLEKCRTVKQLVAPKNFEILLLLLVLLRISASEVVSAASSYHQRQNVE